MTPYTWRIDYLLSLLLLYLQQTTVEYFLTASSRWIGSHLDYCALLEIPHLLYWSSCCRNTQIESIGSFTPFLS
jgi:hypothetical protein